MYRNQTDYIPVLNNFNKWISNKCSLSLFCKR